MISTLRTDIAKKLDGVEGWLAIEDALWLYRHATEAARRVADPIALEIGSWKGRSTIVIALALECIGKGHVFAVDPHLGEPADPSDTMPDFLGNLQRAGVASTVRPIRAFSREPVDQFGDRSIAFAFLDGSHEYKEVVRDIATWEPKLAEGAVIAFDDADWIGVNLALREHVCRRNSPFRSPRYLGKILYCNVSRERAWTIKDSVAAMRLALFLRALMIGRKCTPHLHWRLLPATRFALRGFLNAPLRRISTS